ncbi:anti-sigma factor [Lysobacter psychrotolerans]|uniref:Anti-sigma factor n=2 Tax=Montanilutibacter psychrotolerans TaxID=1327343 RepID=A0A3M8SM88_9GAMM|nr:anti-sigma factor [Lysobacter psychrotolerans]
MNDGMSAVARYLPARLAQGGRLPWIPATTPGKSSMPLRFFRDNRGFVELLRMEPGVEMPLHRHIGATHAYHLSGSRQLSTGEIFGPGDYECEPPGNTDAWKIVGDEPLTALVIVMGEVEFLGPDGGVRGRANADSQWQEYRRHCHEHGLALLDLFDP